MKFDGRVSLITGAGSGMGQAYAQVLSESGCDIVINDVNVEAAQETANIVEGNGRRAVVEIADVMSSAAVNDMVARAIERFGKIDILFNNAGFGQQIPLEQITDEDWDRILRIHLNATFYCTRAVVPHMKAQRYGKIVNISSMWGMVGAETALHYCTAKAGVLGFTKALARQLAPWNINVNAIAPGGVLTPAPMKARGLTKEQWLEVVKEKIERVPLNRWAEPIEIGYLGAFLVSDEASFITGQVVSPNGGEVIVGI